MNETPGSLLHYLRHVTGVLRADPRTDTELLRAFVANRDEGAFVALVWRHGPLVWRTCLSVLHDERDAEDAFQATFLALVQQAGEVRTETLPNWLGRVAQRTSLNVRKIATRRTRRHEQLGRQMFPESYAVADAATAVATEDTRSLVREELAQLPERLRAVLTLYYFHGHTQIQIGEMLGVSEQTVRKRLTQGMAKLQRQLGQRGLVMNALVLGGLLGPNLWATAGDFPAGLATRAAGAAVAYTDGRMAEIPATVLALAARVVPPRVPLFLLLVTGLVLVAVGGVGSVWAYHRVAEPERPAEVAIERGEKSPGDPQAPKEPTELPSQADKAKHPAPALKPIAVLTGQARDREGRAVPFARVSVLANEPQFGQAGTRDQVLGETVADAQGRFQISVPPFRTNDPARMHVKLLAAAPNAQGLGTKVVPLRPGIDTKSADVTVQPARVITGRIVAGTGQPVAGAVVRVMEMADVIRDPVIGEPGNAVTGWPMPVRTDSDGRFELRGAITESAIVLTVDHADHAYHLVKVSPESSRLEIKLGPPRQLSGRVIDESGRPIPSALIVAVAVVRAFDSSPTTEFGNPVALTTAQMNGVLVGRNVRADAEGRFAFSVPQGQSNVVLWVHPREAGTETLAVARILAWPTGITSQSLGDVRLPRGALIRGRVVDDAGVPVANASVRFNPTSEPEVAGWIPLTGASTSVLTGDTGAFQLTVPPGTGRVVVTGPTRNYVAEPDDPFSLGLGQGGRISPLVHASVPCDPRQRSDTEMTISLLRGQSLEGTAELPDGTPVAKGWAVCHHLVAGPDKAPMPVPIRNGRFSLPGCRPGYAYSILMRTEDGRYGAYARLSCCEIENPAIVTLQPSGSVSGGFQTITGKAVVGTSVSLAVMLEAESLVGTTPKKPPIILPYVYMFGHGPAARESTGEDGCVAFSSLVPGAKHVLWPTEKNRGAVRGFVPREGKTLVLPPTLLTQGNSPNRP